MRLGEVREPTVLMPHKVFEAHPRVAIVIVAGSERPTVIAPFRIVRLHMRRQVGISLRHAVEHILEVGLVLIRAMLEELRDDRLVTLLEQPPEQLWIVDA